MSTSFFLFLPNLFSLVPPNKVKTANRERKTGHIIILFPFLRERESGIYSRKEQTIWVREFFVGDFQNDFRSFVFCLVQHHNRPTDRPSLGPFQKLVVYFSPPGTCEIFKLSINRLVKQLPISLPLTSRKNRGPPSSSSSSFTRCDSRGTLFPFFFFPVE